MIKYKKDTDNIVTLTLDMAGRSVNVINHEISKAFIPVIEHLKQEKAKHQLKGVIITSNKKSFLAGGDLDYLFQVKDSTEVFNYTQTLQQFFRDLESPGVPVVAAINGTALGTGFELALACHHRIVVDNIKIRLGHPEVTLGMMPGSGGVIRLLWLLGLEKAYRVLAGGKRLTPTEALKAGLVDELARDDDDMLERAKVWLINQTEGRRPWDQEGMTIPGGTAKDRPVAKTIQRLAANLVKETYNNYPAQQAILNTLVEGSKVDFDTACRIESRYFTSLMVRQVAKNMTKAFWFDTNAIKGGEIRPKGFGKFRPKKVGIIGAGMMGSGIAFSCALRGLEVVIKDISKSVAQRGKEFAAKKLHELVERGKIRAEESTKILSKIHATEKAQAFEDCDIVIEAVFENEMVKNKATKEAETYMDEYSFFGTNSLSIPISSLAKASSRPENYVGMHFFPPADEVPLVEIVRGAKTSEETIARAFDFVRRIRKVPIIVKDNWGFYAARVQNTYILEGISLLQEGFAPPLIENLGLQAGMPKGALALADDLSLDIVLRYEKQAAEHYGTKYIQHPADEALELFINELKRRGRAKKAGFYEYQEDGSRQLWTELTEHFPTTQKTFSREELTERLMFTQVIEAVWCLQEGIIQSIPEANLGSIYGWGFPAFKGGALQYVNDYGLEKFIEKCSMYESRLGPRFKVPSLLKKKMKKGELLV